MKFTQSVRKVVLRHYNVAAVFTQNTRKTLFTQLFSLTSGAVPWYVTMAQAFFDRVSVDSGQAESQSCLESRLQALEPYYERMSLLMLPHAYKESKLYSIIPADGSGDFAFTRASTIATRKESGGLIEASPYNLSAFSENLNSWTKSNATVTSNVILAPNGTLTADKLLDTVSNSSHFAYTASFTFSIGQAYTYSAYIKKGDHSEIYFQPNEGGASFPNLRFNFDTGLIVTSSGFTNMLVETLANGWFKLTLTRTVITAGATLFAWFLFQGATVYIGNSTGSYIWGCQCVYGAAEKPYQVTTTRQNFPRLDYSNGSCPELLLEPARTNLLLRSEEFDNASWTKTNISVTPNTEISPDGLTTGDSCNITNASNELSINATVTASTIYLFSFYVKAGTSGSLNYRVYNNTGAADIISSTSYYSQVNSSTYTRVTVSFTTPVGCLSVKVYLSDNSGTGTFFPWGAQLEAGSYASSYIPTTSAAVTRTLDTLSQTSISNLIGQTEGTIYFESNLLLDSASRFITISDGTTNNRITIYVGNTNSLQCSIVIGGVNQGDLVYGVITAGLFKVCVVYANNYAALFVNGVKIAQDLSLTVPACSRLGFDQGNGTTNWSSGSFKSLALMPVKLSDAECIALTT